MKWKSSISSREKDIKLIIICTHLRDDSGFELCRKIRDHSSIPIIFLSPPCPDSVMIEALDIGGDDFITMPFDPNVLAARIRSTIRRSLMISQAAESGNTLSLNKSGNTITMNFQRQKADLNGTELLLSSKEFHILATLIRQPDQPISPTDLYTSIWGTDSLGDTRTLKVHISHLRKKIEKAAPSSFTINAVKGIGYKIGIGETD